MLPPPRERRSAAVGVARFEAVGFCFFFNARRSVRRGLISACWPACASRCCTLGRSCGHRGGRWAAYSSWSPCSLSPERCPGSTTSLIFSGTVFSFFLSFLRVHSSKKSSNNVSPDLVVKEKPIKIGWSLRKEMEQNGNELKGLWK